MEKKLLNKGSGIAKITDWKSDTRLMTSLHSCVHCGLCAESCLYYLSTHDPGTIPAQKVEAVAALYKRYNTKAGQWLPSLFKAKEWDEDQAKKLVDLLYGTCTLCGRCNLHCSVGVDIAYVVGQGRKMLAEMGMVPPSLQSTVNAALETWNNMSIPKEEFLATLQWMEEELVDEIQDSAAIIPVDQAGKNILYTLNPREPKFFPLSIAAMAKIFYAAGESWTLSSQMYDVTNYAFFSGDPQHQSIIASRLAEEVARLDAKQLVLAECGHGTRAFRWEAPNYLKTSFPFKTVSSVELIAGYLKEGRIKLDPDKIKEKVTIHDPCNLVRNGGIIEEQRTILRHFVRDFVEMQPHGADNYCCGGGGGQLAMSEYNERRMKIAGVKAEQIRKTGAKIVVTPCHNCVDQLQQTNHAFHLGVQIKTLAEIVSDALILD